MLKMKLVGVLAATAIAVPMAGSGGDWKGDLARKAVTRAAREGLENAMKDAALDTVLDAAVPEAATYAASRFREIDQYEAIGEVVVGGVDDAMRVADVASKLDDAADAAKALKKINKIRKIR